jgi:hypothetical protein
MPTTANKPKDSSEHADKTLLGLTRKQRFRVYRWSAVIAVVAAMVWTFLYLQPHRWYTYTDVVSFEQVSRDVEVGYVLWEPALLLDEQLQGDQPVIDPTVSSDGARMVYAASGKDDTMDLFLRRWDGPASSRRLRHVSVETASSSSLRVIVPGDEAAWISGSRGGTASNTPGRCR